MQSPPSSSAPHTIEESIPLRANELVRFRNRNGWDTFIASVPVPALWVTAHVDLSLSRPRNVSLDQLTMDLKTSQSRDSIANAYRSLLQKVITKLNRKILKSRDPTTTFRFLGSLERNACDIAGKHLHYHFFLWDSQGPSMQESRSLELTSATLKALWLQKVNAKESDRYNPIDIQIVRDPQDAVRVASYTNKSNPLNQSYELFDDWSTSRLSDTGES